MSKEKLEEIDFGALSDTVTDYDDIYPTIWFMHGSELATEGYMKTGGFFVDSTRFPTFNAPGWTPDIFRAKDRTQRQGLTATNVRLSVIRMKEAWRKEEGKNVPYIQALVFVEGFNELCLLSLKKPTKAGAFKDVFEAHRSTNVKFANSIRKDLNKKVQEYALWLPLKVSEPVESSSKENPNVKSWVTPMLLDNPEKVDKAYVDSLWVGKENYPKFDRAYRETADWQKKPIKRVIHDEQEDAPTHTGGAETGEIATGGTLYRLTSIMRRKGISEEKFLAENNLRSLDDLTEAQANMFIAAIRLIGEN